MMEEEERLRIPTAQGLPWTTDEPEVYSNFSWRCFAQSTIMLKVLFDSAKPIVEIKSFLGAQGYFIYL